MNQIRSQLRIDSPLDIWFQCYWTLQTSSDTMLSKSQALMDSPHHSCHEECLSSSRLAPFLQTFSNLHHSYKPRWALVRPSWVTCPHSVSRVQAEEISDSAFSQEPHIWKSPYYRGDYRKRHISIYTVLNNLLRFMGIRSCMPAQSYMITGKLDLRSWESRMKILSL